LKEQEVRKREKLEAKRKEEVRTSIEELMSYRNNYYQRKLYD